MASVVERLLRHFLLVSVKRLTKPIDIEVNWRYFICIPQNVVKQKMPKKILLDLSDEEWADYRQYKEADKKFTHKVVYKLGLASAKIVYQPEDVSASVRDVVEKIVDL